MLDEITQDLVDHLSQSRELELIDLQAIEAYAGQLYRMRVARELVADEGLVVEGLRGPTTHPAVAVEREASSEMRQWITRRPDLFAPIEEEKDLGDEPGADPDLDGSDVLDGLSG